MAQTVDPLAGSYYVESLTTSIEQGAREYLDRIDALGGMAAAVERGWVQREIEDAAYRQQQAIDWEKGWWSGLIGLPGRTKIPGDSGCCRGRWNGNRSSACARSAPGVIRGAGKRLWIGLPNRLGLRITLCRQFLRRSRAAPPWARLREAWAKFSGNTNRLVPERPCRP